MKRVACVLLLAGLAAGDEWAEAVPVFTPETAACSVAGYVTVADERGFWFRLGWRGPGEYLFCVGHLDDGTPLFVASAQAAFFYDPLARTLLEIDRAHSSFRLGVDQGSFICRFASESAEKGRSFDFRVDLRSMTRGLSRSVRVEDGRRTGLTARGTYVSFRNAPSGAVTRVVVDTLSDYRCEAEVGGGCATSVDAESLAALRRVAKRATAVEMERFTQDLERVFRLLPLLRDEAARDKLGEADAPEVAWPDLVESHARMRTLLDRAVGAGPAFGGYEDGNRLAARGDRRGALARWLDAACAGDVRSMCLVGRAILVDRDLGEPAEGFDWLRRSADAGFGPAFTMLGSAYLRGRGCEPDFARAREWLEAAVARGDAAARYELGWMCMRGQGVAPRPDRAIELWKEAAANEHAPSMNSLGIVFEHGRGVEADLAQAAVWYACAVELGYVEAMVRLGCMYEEGRGVREDATRAFDLYRRAAESGSPRAQYHLAACYGRGTGVEPDPARARELMLESARGGYDFAQLAVARGYLEGLFGFRQSLPRGAAWLRIAADGGSEKARKELERIEPTMSEAQRVVWYATLSELRKKMR